MNGILITEINGELFIEVHGYDRDTAIRIIKRAYHENVKMDEEVNKALINLPPKGPANENK